MPKNPNARRCSHAGCNAYAVRGLDPPLCSAHAGRTAGAGAPPGNQNRRSHGVYARYLDPEDLADLVATAADTTIDDEIACARVALRRLLAELQQPPDRRTADFDRLIALTFAGVRTIARLLRDRAALSGEAADGLSGAFAQVLDHLGTQLGLEL